MSDVFACSGCAGRFLSAQQVHEHIAALERHVDAIVSVLPMVLAHAPQLSHQQQNRLYHATTQHSVDRSRFPCPACGQIFARSLRREDHYWRHVPINAACRCKANIFTVQDLMRHRCGYYKAMNTYRASWKAYASEQLRQACSAAVWRHDQSSSSSSGFPWPGEELLLDEPLTGNNLSIAGTGGDSPYEGLLSHAAAITRRKGCGTSSSSFESQETACPEEGYADLAGQHRSSDIRPLVD